MTWLLRQRDPELPEHRCAPPMSDHLVMLPAGGSSMDFSLAGLPPEPVKVGERPDGTVGDVWACDDCTAVWRIGPPEHPGGLLPGGRAYAPRGYDRWQQLSPRQARRVMRRALRRG